MDIVSVIIFFLAEALGVRVWCDLKKLINQRTESDDFHNRTWKISLRSGSPLRRARAAKSKIRRREGVSWKGAKKVWKISQSTKRYHRKQIVHMKHIRWLSSHYSPIPLALYYLSRYIVCHLVTYGRLKQKKKFKHSALKLVVAAYKRFQI